METVSYYRFVLLTVFNLFIIYSLVIIVFVKRKIYHFVYDYYITNITQYYHHHISIFYIPCENVEYDWVYTFLSDFYFRSVIISLNEERHRDYKLISLIRDVFWLGHLINIIIRNVRVVIDLYKLYDNIASFYLT